MSVRSGGFDSTLLDIARVFAAVLSLVLAVRQRFGTGIVCGLLLLGALGAGSVGAYLALAARTIPGDYGIEFVFVGPTALPLGGREWLPLAFQGSAAALSAVPVFVAMRRQLRVGSDYAGTLGWYRPWDRMTNVLLLSFSANVSLLVGAALTTWCMWRLTR
jgi:hypothetical protein